MKVILLQHVPGLGKKGEIKEVSDGYFRNQLAPKKLASIATDGTMKSVQNQLQKSKEKQEKSLESARFIEERLKDKVLTIKHKASDTGNLYGAIHEKDLILAIEEQFAVSLDSKSLKIKEALKHLGAYQIEVHLHPQVKFSLSLEIHAL